MVRRWLIAVGIALLAGGAAGPAVGKPPAHGKQAHGKSKPKKSAHRKARRPEPHKATKASANKVDRHGRHADKHQERGKGKGRKHEPEPPMRDPALDTEPRAARDPNSPREQRITELRQHLDDVLRDKPLSRTRIGVAVMDARDGDVLYAHNADKLFNPASNTKILTTAAALSELGGDWRYVTRLVGPAPDDQGVIHGSVELRGAGDPSLTTNGVAEIARDLAARGVTRIEGDLLCDGKFRDGEHPGESLGGGAIIMNKNVYTVHIMPTEKGKNAIVRVEPSSPEFFGAVSKVTTVPKRKTRIRLDAYRDGGRFIVVAKGRINPKDDVKLKEHIGDGSSFALTALRHALADFGIELTGKARSGTLAPASKESGKPSRKSSSKESGKASASAGTTASDAINAMGATAAEASAVPALATLAEHRSIPLADICRFSNKDSNNFIADTIFKTLGRERFGGAATMEKGTRAVQEMLAAIGFAPSSYHIVNGSGLTHENRIQPSALTRLLRHLYFDLAVAPEFVTSLAIGGVDGTIKGRFRSRDMIGMVRAKTGTLSNVSALSGYLGDHGDVLIFVILVDDFHHRRLEDIRDAQVRLVKQMMSFLRAGRPQLPPSKLGPGGPDDEEAMPPGAGPAPDDEDDDEESDEADQEGGAAEGAGSGN